MRTTLRGEIRSHLLNITCVPSSALKSALDTLTVNGTRNDLAKNLLVSLTFSNDYEVSKTADDAVPHGRVVQCDGDNVAGYLLTVEMYRVSKSDLSDEIKPSAIVTLPYSGTLALGNKVQVNGTGSPQAVDVESGTNGLGFVIALDSTAGEVDVIL